MSSRITNITLQYSHSIFLPRTAIINYAHCVGICLVWNFSNTLFHTKPQQSWFLASLIIFLSLSACRVLKIYLSVISGKHELIATPVLLYILISDKKRSDSFCGAISASSGGGERVERSVREGRLWTERGALKRSISTNVLVYIIGPGEISLNKMFKGTILEGMLDTNECNYK